MPTSKMNRSLLMDHEPGKSANFLERAILGASVDDGRNQGCDLLLTSETAHDGR